MATDDHSSQSGDASGVILPDIPSVAPDAMGLDGHIFRIKYDVPEEKPQQLEELYDRDAKYEEISEHVKAYEIEMEDSDEEAAKALARRREECAKILAQLKEEQKKFIARRAEEQAKEEPSTRVND
ncbi:hypothetical protein BBP40_011641 [Aspergillus hancockii]|nr:hypothetical protein BBP40_011641 [Aspergillus hancockii]